MANTSETDAKIIAVLTLAKDATGVWITELVNELNKLCVGSERNLRPEVVTLESLEMSGFGVDDGLPESWECVVNRVSDAAEPIMAKACQAVLHAAEIWSIPVYNGPRSYGIGCNKLLHHHIFARAGLVTPRSVLVRFEMGDNMESKLVDAAKMLIGKGCDFPLLLKPNSAGFGSGIEHFQSLAELEKYGRDHTATPAGRANPSNDRTVLLQEYVEPKDGKIYRVWFIRGLAQCATFRRVKGKANRESLTGGCAGGVCSFRPRSQRKDAPHQKKPASFAQKTEGARFSAWSIPREVAAEVQRIVHIVGDDSDAGSIEFLHDSEGRRVYFDLNMLSTLPLLNNGSVDDSDNVWSNDFNPWAELAESIMQRKSQKP